MPLPSPQDLALPKSALTHMDMIRGLSSVAVLVGHMRGPFFVDMRDLSVPSAPMRAFYLMSGLGHQAVVVFFVLSGFFIGTSVLGSVSKGGWSWSQFLLRRFARLYVVLIPALLLTLALDLCGMHLFGVDNIYAGKVNAPFTHFFDARDTLRASSFLGNLFFLQYILVAPYGTNSALWSLGYEFWSYILFPALILAATKNAVTNNRRLLVRIAYAIAALVIFAFGGIDLVFYFGIWLYGALVAAYWRPIAGRWKIRGPFVAMTFIVFVVVLVGARTLHAQKVGDVVLGAATAIFFASLLARDAQRPASSTTGPGAPRSGYTRAATLLAGFSYTLYLVHFPIVAFAHAAMIKGDRWQPTPGRLLIGVTLCALILVVAFALAQLTERHTDVVRAWAGRMMTKLPPRGRLKTEPSAAER